MSATANEIADLVAADLNQSSVQDELSGDFAFEAVRSYLPEQSIEKAFEKLYCFVVPRSMQKKLISRSSGTKNIVVEVGFVCHPPSNLTDSWTDGLVEMVEGVGDYLLGKNYTMDDGYSAYCVETETPIAYDYEAYRTGNDFRSFVMCTFRKEN